MERKKRYAPESQSLLKFSTIPIRGKFNITRPVFEPVSKQYNNSYTIFFTTHNLHLAPTLGIKRFTADTQFKVLNYKEDKDCTYKVCRDFVIQYLEI